MSITKVRTLQSSKIKMAPTKQIHQPIHPSMRSKLDPQYVQLHDELIQYMPTVQSQPWSPASRTAPNPLAYGAQKNVEVGNVFEKEVDDFQIRVFQPSGSAPDEGWPCLVWYHGGGWVTGGLDSENGFLRHACKCKCPMPGGRAGTEKRRW